MDTTFGALAAIAVALVSGTVAILTSHRAEKRAVRADAHAGKLEERKVDLDEFRTITSMLREMLVDAKAEIERCEDDKGELRNEVRELTMRVRALEGP